MENAELPDWHEFGCDVRTGYLGLPVIEYLLDHRDSTNCTEHAADLIWKHLTGHREKFTAQVVSATVRDMDTAMIDQRLASPTKGWKSPIRDLHVTFTKLLPFVPRSGATITVSGLITGYATDPFQFRMKEGEAPELICDWVQQGGPARMSFDEWLYVLRKGEGADCLYEARTQVWNAISEHQLRNGGPRFRVHVVSATQGVMETVMETQQDEEVDLEVRMAKPLQRPPAPGAVVTVKGLFMVRTWSGWQTAAVQTLLDQRQSGSEFGRLTRYPRHAIFLLPWIRVV